jgi:alpha/beta superfamily hydrolase
MSGEPLSLTTDDGVVLEAEMASATTPWAAAVLTHPHPQFGGSMRSIVPGTLFAELPAAGVSALRFNFRGVEGSQGAYDGGRGEQHDVVAAIEALSAEVGEALPLVLAGWSFGADVSLAVGHDRVAGWFAAAPPLRVVDPATMAAAGDPRPKLMAVPERDQFRPPAEASSIVASWPATRLAVVKGADHFFVGRTQVLTPLCLELVRWAAGAGGIAPGR